MKNKNMMKNQSIDHHFFKTSVSIEDVAVAALIKFYLKEMEAEKPGMARIMLEQLVRPSTTTSTGTITDTSTSAGMYTGSTSRRADKVIATIDCAKLAQVIDAARTHAIHSSFMSTEDGDGGEAREAREAINTDGDPLLERTLFYIDGDLLQGLSGSDYITRMPIELADMVMECYGWFVVHQNS